MIHTLSGVGPLFLSALGGAVTGLFAARWLHSRRHEPEAAASVPPADPFVSAEIDQAAARWAQANGHPPEAAGILADRLHALYALARRRGQS